MQTKVSFGGGATRGIEITVRNVQNLVLVLWPLFGTGKSN